MNIRVIKIILFKKLNWFVIFIEILVVLKVDIVLKVIKDRVLWFGKGWVLVSRKIVLDRIIKEIKIRVRVWKMFF